MDFRKVFDGIPIEFDKWRPRYCNELFADVIEYSKLNSSKSVLEIGPGTGQATEPFLKTGCSFLAIELGENLAEFTENKFKPYDNFQIVNADFETYDFGSGRFDLIFSAASIQWIPEAVGYPKIYDILKRNGTLAMFFTRSEPENVNDPLHIKIQEIYDKYFQPETKYTCRLDYNNTEKYGFTDIECHYYNKIRVFTADEYISWISTHADHITLQEPYKSKFYSGIREAILSLGNNIKIRDTITLYLARKP